MAQLPLELLQAVAKDMECDPSIFTLRLVSKRLNSAATPLAFRQCVQVITINICAIEVETSGEAGRDAVRTVFSALAKFPNLQKLRLHFYSCDEEELTTEYDKEEGIGKFVHSPTHFLRLQHEIFAALAAHPPPPLISLTLNNILALSNHIYRQDNFLRIFQSLKELNISVLSNVDPLNLTQRLVSNSGPLARSCIKFWRENVPQMLRSAPAITSLILRVANAVGVYPTLSLKDIFSPHLASLTLRRFVLGPPAPETDRDVVEWILRHKATLTRLKLHGCAIDGGPGEAAHGNYPRPWHAVLAVFEAELGALCDFMLNPENFTDGIFCDPHFGYKRMDPDYGYAEEESESKVPGATQDLPALESLMAVVKSRRDDKDGSD
ncbi:Pribosyltran domain-containing protein [Mycena venus]|uniref:Pribosyltran domain-containing protein n=1 Tax=Mycena venus TaxID=2733690 RepID=A0A8H6WRB5_9AGAR|nr:Pribosyltran domain-containing protein [Mycena venus]